jgi:D-sedoheptulose 7-phosphate isomerase
MAARSEIDSMAATDRRRLVASILEEASRIHQRVSQADLAPVVEAADAIADAFAGGRKLLVFGNGGSAADAQHLSAELVGRFVGERAALPAIALSTDTSILTAVSNDYGYARGFARQVEALGRPGDVALAISTSGASANVIAALRVARDRDLRTVALTGGDGGETGRLADVHINVPGSSTARTQEVHGTLLHALCVLIEQRLGAAHV